MAWATACPTARWAPSPLRNGTSPPPLRTAANTTGITPTTATAPLGHTCPSAQSRQLQPQAVPADVMAGLTGMAPTSMLAQWPVQIKLMPLKAPYYDGANLLVAADCTAYAYANFHAQFMRSHVTLIGCPKLDDVDYTEKLTAIIRDNNIKSVCIVRMEVPCCGGLEQAVKNALQASGKFLPWQVVTISIDGHILD